MNDFNEYQSYVDKQHVPTTLMEQTKLQMHQEYLKIKYKRNIFRRSLIIAASICCIVGFGLLQFSKSTENRIQFKQLEGDAFQTSGDIHLGNLQPENRKVSLSQFNEYLNTSYSDKSVIKDFRCIYQENEVTFKGLKDAQSGRASFLYVKSDTILSSEISFDTINDCVYTIDCGVRRKLFPSVMKDAKKNMINGNEVLLAKSNKDDVYLAYYEKEDFSYLIKGKKMEEKIFIELLKQIMLSY